MAFQILAYHIYLYSLSHYNMIYMGYISVSNISELYCFCLKPFLFSSLKKYQSPTIPSGARTIVPKQNRDRKKTSNFII
jgi:hypothetical protein